MPFTFHLVIPSPSNEDVLLIDHGNGWALPRVSSPERTVVHAVVAGVKEQLGLDVLLLRGALLERGRLDHDGGDVFFLTENLDDSLPTRGRWFGEDALATGLIVDDADLAAIRQWFTERGDPKRRMQPWQREGWYAAAVGWINETLSGVSSVAQYSTWCASSLLRVETGEGRFYFKAAPDFFHSEPVVTATLAEHFPSTIPRPVAIDEERGWMLLEDFGDAIVGEMAVEHWDGALDALLTIQQASLPILGTLLTAGCVDRRLEVLAAQIARFAEGSTDELSHDTLDRLRAAVPRLQELCVDVAEAKIPATLVHGDFHLDNIVIKDGRHLIFDWTDACIAHPFVDLATFFYGWGPASTDTELRRRLRDRYLLGWSDLIPLDEAVHLFERTEPLAAMHHAITYRRILDALDPSERVEFTSALSWWVDKALESLPA
ncbi:MAG: aminoglycoside phosphotransferase family protein [Actinomycetota bacterium]|nr:aminoglycoside phosphotransferase family protein [Actinomycetota bacterium]